MKTLNAILTVAAMAVTAGGCGPAREVIFDHRAEAARDESTAIPAPGPGACGAVGPAGLVAAGDGMPALRVIREATFSGPYSCGGRGYQDSALFLSRRVHEMNAPDLLYNGACGSPGYLQASTAGDDFSVIADLGEVPLESVTAARALNYEQVVGRDNVFRAEVEVAEGHTYAVLIAKADHRALFALTVTRHVPDCVLSIRYAVLSYSMLEVVEESKGFCWDGENR